MANKEVPAPPKADWYTDPTGRHQLRYWDGSQWTPHVSDDGVTAADPLGTGDSALGGFGGIEVSTRDHQPEAIKKQVREKAGIGTPAASGGGDLFTEPILVVNQKAKLIEV